MNFEGRINNLPCDFVFRHFLNLCAFARFHSSFQPARLTRTFQNLTCQISRLGRPIRQHLIDVTQIGSKLRAFFPGVGKIIPVILKQRLFQVAVAKPAGSEAAFEISADLGRLDEL